MSKIIVFLVTFLLTLICLSSADSAGGDSFWTAYRQQLFSFLKGGQATHGMQIITKPVVAKYDTHPEEQSLADILNPVSKSGEVRVVSDKSDLLPMQYYDFLSNLKVSAIDPKLEKTIEKQKENVAATVKLIEIEEPKCKSRYEQYKEYGIAQGSFDQFIQKWCSRLSSALTELAMEEMELKRLAAGAADEDIRSALARFEKALETENFGWRETFTTSLSYFRQKIQKNHLNGFHISISKSQLRNQETQTEWTATEEPFIKNAKGKSFSLSSSTDKFNLDIKATGYVAIHVAPEKWYSQDVIDNHKSGPFKDSTLAKQFFGKNRKLSILPTKLYMVYQPEIILQVGSEDVEYFKSTPKINIGPFSGAVESISEIASNDDAAEEEPEEKETKSSKLYRIVVKDQREDPLIVAVDNKLM